MMAEVRIILSGLWVAVILTYLLGDVLRIFSGDAAAMKLTVWYAWKWVAN